MMCTFTGLMAKQQKRGSWFLLLVSFIFSLSLSSCGHGGDSSSEAKKDSDGQVQLATMLNRQTMKLIAVH